MSGKHTPGPWEADGEYVHAVEFIRLCCGRGYSSCCGDPEISESRFQIAQCAPENARLIAAAPDLLEALTAVMDWIENWNPNFTHDDEWPVDRDAARAAIARATGEQG